jgi:hypothetical protein
VWLTTNPLWKGNMAPKPHRWAPFAPWLRGLVFLSAAGLIIAAGCGGHPEGKVKAVGGEPAGGTPAGGAPASGAPAAGAPVRPPGDSLKVTLALDAGGYAIGETMEMKLVATNVAGRPVTLTFPTAQRFDFIVRRDGKPLWQWGADMMFAESLTRETLAPGDSLVLGTKWNQVLGNGTNPPLGAYTIQGVLKITPEIVTAEKRFGVVD